MGASRRPRTERVELQTVAAEWQLALDCADQALTAAVGVLLRGELTLRRRALARERRCTADLLSRVRER